MKHVLLFLITFTSFKVAAKEATTSKEKTSEGVVDASTTNTKNATVEDKVELTQAATVKSEVSLKDVKKKNEESKFSSILDMSFTTDSKKQNEDKALSTDMWLFLYYKLSSDYKARLRINVSKDLANSYETTINNTKLTFSKSAHTLSDTAKLSPSVTVVIPTSERSKRNEEMITALEVNPSLSYRLTEKLYLSYLPRIVKNFHEYETSRTNAVNTEYRLIQFYGASYAISEKLTFDPLLVYVDSWSYKGTQRNPQYTTYLEFGYSYSKDLTFAVGTSTGGSIFDRENGPDETVQLYDRNSSNIYGKFAYKF